MAQVAEITYGQKVMEKETEKRISEIEGERDSRLPFPQTPLCGRVGGGGHFFCSVISVLRCYGFFGTSLVLYALT